MPNTVTETVKALAVYDGKDLWEKYVLSLEWNIDDRW